jgi:hypothetical protein
MNVAKEVPTRRLTQFMVLCGFMGTALAADPFVGAWKLDPARSAGTLPKDETVVIQERGRDFSVEVTATIESPAQTLLIQYTAPSSGGAGHVEKGPYDGVILGRVDARTMDTTYLSNGKPVRSTRAVLSKDGASITSTGRVLDSGAKADWVMVFRKEPK